MFTFQSLCSGSAGNALLLSAGKTRLLVDCGYKSMKQCRLALAQHCGGAENLTGVVLTHSHGDHIGRMTLQVLSGHNVPVYCHPRVANELIAQHGSEPCRTLKIFGSEPFKVGTFALSAFELEHHPGMQCNGFVIETTHRKHTRKSVIMTDFCQFTDSMVKAAANANFIYVEANHNTELLKKYFQPGAKFHMENSKTGYFLYHIIQESKTRPHTVMLGHLSEDRNTPELALKEVTAVFARENMPLPFNLLAAPYNSPSEIITIAE